MDITFVGGNNITLSADTAGSKMVISAGNYLTTAMASNRGSDFMGTNTALTANGVSVTANSSGLSLNFPAFLTTAAQSNQVINSINGSTGTFSFNTGSSLSSSRVGNAITFGLASNITTALQSAGAYLTTARASNDAIGLNSALTANGVSVTANSSGLSLNFPAFLTTAQSPGAYLTTAMQSGSQSQVWVMGNSSGTIGGTNISGTMFSNGLSLSANAPAAGVGIAAGTRTATTAGNILFDSGNGITFGLNAVGGSVMTASHNGLTTAAQSNQVVNSLNGSTGQISLNVGSSLSSSTAGSSITFGLASNITTALQSAGAYLTTAMASNRGSDFVQATAAFAGTNASGTINSNGISVSVAAPGGGGGVMISAGTNSRSTGTVDFENSNGVSFGMDTNGTITASVVQPATLSQFANAQILINTSNNVGVAGGNAPIFPITVPYYVSVDFVRFLNSGLGGLGVASTMTATTSANTSATVGKSNTLAMMLMTKGTGASSQSLYSVLSTEYTNAMQMQITVGAVGSQYTYNYSQSMHGAGGVTTSFSTSIAISNASVILPATSLGDTRFSGNRFLDMPLSTLLTPGVYWMFLAHRTSITTQAASFSNHMVGRLNVNTLFGLGGSNITNFGPPDGATTVASLQMPFYMQGNITSAAPIYTTSAIPFSSIRANSSGNAFPIVQFIKEA